VIWPTRIFKNFEDENFRTFNKGKFSGVDFLKERFRKFQISEDLLIKNTVGVTTYFCGRDQQKVVGFLRVLRFPPTGKVDRVG
jgi:hypothetical protein